MLADRQTTGGYVKLGAVITADLPLAAQKRPGDTIRFQRCTVEEAQMLLRRLRRQLHHAAQALDDMAVESARLERTFREVMDLSAPEQPLHKLPLDLCQLVSQMDRMGEEIKAQCGTTLRTDCGGLTQCLVWGDRAMAEQICFHLLSNALHAVAPGGSITVGLCRTEQDVTLFVEDDGCGLPEGESWLENRRRFLGGAQAGLLLCRRYCRQLGWELALLPRSPQGARAELKLPLPVRPVPIEATVEFRSSADRTPTALQHQLRRELYLLTRKTPLSD